MSLSPSVGSPAQDPLALFAAWFDEAVAAGVVEPEACALGTASRDGQPAVRIVLYRGLSHGGPRFFTNYESRKGRELADNPLAAMTFFWQPLGRQVRFEGRTERLSAAESDEYFQQRPRGHQLNALASPQSRPIPGRQWLVEEKERLEARYAGHPVPRPEGWGGFRLVPQVVEFWTLGSDRFHTRRVFRRVAAGWTEQLLGP
jgi:pyridoxamine 5'-phosphate oxidase